MTFRRLLPLIATALLVVPSGTALAQRNHHKTVTPPTASFVYSPSAPVTGNPVTFNGAASNCTATPCTYEWSDDGSAKRPSTVLWPLGSGQTIHFTFKEVGTKYVRLVVTNSNGQTGTVEHNVVVKPSVVIEEAPKEELKEEEKTEEVTKEPPKEENPSGQKNCISNLSGCGYPASANSGVLAGTTLTPSGSETISTPNTTVKNVAISGELIITANNTTVENTEISSSGGSGSHAVYISSGVTGTKFNHFTCKSNNVQYCIFGTSPSTDVTASYLTGCGECFSGPGTIENTYMEANANISAEHYEDIYYGGGAGALVVNHDTLLNPHEQTAAVFASVDFGNQTTLSITNSILAGGDYVIYGGGSGSGGKVVGPVTIAGNRFSKVYEPNGGYYGVAAYLNESVTKWSNNIWDETLATIEE